jgi:hypothetical protein
VSEKPVLGLSTCLTRIITTPRARLRWRPLPYLFECVQSPGSWPQGRARTRPPKPSSTRTENKPGGVSSSQPARQVYTSKSLASKFQGASHVQNLPFLTVSDSAGLRRKSPPITVLRTVFATDSGAGSSPGSTECSRNSPTGGK